MTTLGNNIYEIGEETVIFELSLSLSGILYMVSTIEDRQTNLRKLINFGGVDSLNYYTAMIFADWIIYTVP